MCKSSLDVEFPGPRLRGDDGVFGVATLSTDSSLQLDVSSDEAILIDYLEGELTSKERQLIEDRLTKEPDLRETLTRLEESWRCLDMLENYPTDKELVEDTLETVVLDAELSLTRQMRSVRRRFPWKTVALGFGVVFMLAFGFVFGKGLAPDKNFFLIVASPIIDRLDMYTLIDGEDPTFLPLLAQRRVFLEPLDTDGRQDDDLAEYMPEQSRPILESFSIFPYPREAWRRINQINNRDDALFNHFYRNYEQFYKFSSKKKFQLLHIHEAIEKSPKRHELMQTLKAYHSWWKSLQSYEKNEIRKPGLTPEQRVDRIVLLKKRLEQHQKEQAAMPLKDDENQPSLETLAAFLTTLEPYHQELVLNLPPDQTRPYLTRLYLAHHQK